jgi:hypothetical protein
MGSGYNKSCVGINGGVYYVIPWFDGLEGLVVDGCAMCGVVVPASDWDVFGVLVHLL